MATLLLTGEVPLLPSTQISAISPNIHHIHSQPKSLLFWTPESHRLSRELHDIGSRIKKMQGCIEGKPNYTVCLHKPENCIFKDSRPQYSKSCRGTYTQIWASSVSLAGIHPAMQPKPKDYDHKLDTRSTSTRRWAPYKEKRKEKSPPTRSKNTTWYNGKQIHQTTLQPYGNMGSHTFKNKHNKGFQNTTTKPKRIKTL